MSTDPIEPGAWPTAPQWVGLFVDAGPERQLEMAERVLSNSQEANECFVMDHKGRLVAAEAECGAIRTECQMVRAQLVDAHQRGYDLAVERAERAEAALARVGKLCDDAFEADDGGRWLVDRDDLWAALVTDTPEAERMCIHGKADAHPIVNSRIQCLGPIDGN